MKICWVLLIVTGCAGPGPTPTALDALLGVYRGSFDSALTADTDDDLNVIPCKPDDDACLASHAPLADIVLTLERDTARRPRLTFYPSAAAQTAGRPLDLLGAGCRTDIGPGSKPVERDGSWRIRFPLDAQNRLCLGKLRPTSAHHLDVELTPGSPPQALVLIDKSLEDANYLYVTEHDVQRRVRIDLDNSVREGHVTQYRVCIENDLGEFERCVLTDRKFRSFGLPLPVPGGVAVNYTWWYALTPDLQASPRRYRLEQYTGRFERLDD